MTTRNTVNVANKPLTINIRATGKAYVVVMVYEGHKVRTISISHTIALTDAYRAMQQYV